MSNLQPSRLARRSALLAFAALTPLGAGHAIAADISVPTFVVRAGLASQSFTLHSTGAGTDIQTGFDLRAQIGDGQGPGVDPRFTAVDFTLPLWNLFPASTLGTLEPGYLEYAQVGIAYDNTGDSAPADGPVVRLSIDTVGVPAGLYPLLLAGSDIGADSEFIAPGGDPIPTTISNGNLLVASADVTIPAAITNAQTIDALNVSTLTVEGNLLIPRDTATSRTAALTIPSGGQLDLTNTSLVVSGGTDADIISLIQSASLVSTSAGSSTTPDPRDTYAGLAVFSNNARGGIPYYNTFGGYALTASDVLIFYTYLGDTDLDGRVTATDIANIIEGLSLGLTGWANGDINYDGTIDATDLALALASFENQTTAFSASAAPTTGGAIPEPAAPALLLPLATLLRRRR